MARRRNRDYENDIYDSTVEDQEPVDEVPASPKKRIGKVIGTSYLRVRNRPTIQRSEVVSVLQEGDEVRILDDAENKFYKIDLGKDDVGYISCKYCEEVI